MKKDTGSEKEGLLSRELAYFEKEQDALLRAYPNRYLVIHGEEVEGDYSTFDAALEAGIESHGHEPVLIRRPGDKTETLVAPALALGIL